MPMTPKWEDEQKTIICTESEGRWTWDEFHQALDRIVEMAKSVEHRVDLINTAAPTAVTPKGSGMPHYQRGIRSLPDNVKLLIFANRSRLVKVIFSLFSNFQKQGSTPRLVITASMEEAHKVIEEDRTKQTLPG